MTSGAGYLAIASVIFGNWRIGGTVLACLLFGAATALQFQLPALGHRRAQRAADHAALSAGACWRSAAWSAGRWRRRLWANPTAGNQCSTQVVDINEVSNACCSFAAASEELWAGQGFRRSARERICPCPNVPIRLPGSGETSGPASPRRARDRSPGHHAASEGVRARPPRDRPPALRSRQAPVATKIKASASSADSDVIENMQSNASRCGIAGVFLSAAGDLR